jgi:uncharacterized alpha-E superfamily protein
MLSSTADHLYWMARSMERAENAARMLDVTHRMSLLKHSTLGPNQEWSAMLAISGLQQEFTERKIDLTADNVIRFMALDEENGASIYNSLHNARENARAVRGTITSEMWEALNHTWLDMRDMSSRGLNDSNAAQFFEWVKERSHLSRGITHGTLLRDDALRFLRLGTFLERADNTARILDVKYHILLPSLADVGGAADYYQWGALLRSVSAFESYRKVYRDLITPKRVAELLVLRPDMPRSLAACMNEVNRLVHEINGPRSGELERKAGLLHAELKFGRIEDIVTQGLHEYLTGFLARIKEIGELVNTTYFWSLDE